MLELSVPSSCSIINREIFVSSSYRDMRFQAVFLLLVNVASFHTHLPVRSKCAFRAGTSPPNLAHSARKQCVPRISQLTLTALPREVSLAAAATLRGGVGVKGTPLGRAIALNVAVGCVLAAAADLLAQASQLDFGSDRRHFQSPYLLALRGTAGKKAKVRRIHTPKKSIPAQPFA